MSRINTHFLRLNPVERRTHRPAPEWRPAAGLLLEIPAIFFWLLLTLSSVFDVHSRFFTAFERFLQSASGTAVLYLTNLVLPIVALALAVLTYNRRSRKTDLSTVVLGISAFLILLILVYSLGRGPRLT